MNCPVSRSLITAVFLLFPCEAGAQHQSGFGIITGRVFHSGTSNVIPSANIIILGSTLGASADTEGRFIIQNIPPGSYEVRASGIGFAHAIQRGIIVKSDEKTELTFSLSEQSVQLGEVVTTGDQVSAFADQPPGTRYLSYKEIQNTAGGFEDVIRTVAIMPGVMQSRFDRNDLSVRGGAASENLFLVDGIEIANINHFGAQGSGGGSVSFIDLDFIESTNFSSGGFGVFYGDRMSSVLSIGLRDGRSDRLRCLASLSATQAGLNFEGPLGSTGSYEFSVRRSYLDPLFKLNGFSYAPYYYDFLAKAAYRLGIYDKLEFLCVGALDRMTPFNDTQEERTKNNHVIFSDQTKITGGCTWRHGFDLGFLSVSGWHTSADIQYHQTGDWENPELLNSSYEGETALKGDATLQILHSTECSLGAGVLTARLKSNLSVDAFNSGFIESDREIMIPALHERNDTSGYKFHAYIQIAQTIDPFVLTAGARWDYFSMIDNNSVLSPRASVKVYLLRTTAVTLSAGRFYQSPSYIWILGNSYNHSLTYLAADHYAARIDHEFQSDIKMSIEGYVKKYDHYPLSLTQPFMVMVNSNPELQSINEAYESFGLDYLQSSGTGQARGIEFFLQKQFSETPLYGRLSVSLSEASFTALDGISRPGSNDQRWKVSLSAGYIYNEEWEFNATFRYSTGRPYTPFTDGWSRSGTSYNSVRTGANHSLDIRVNRRWVMTSWVLHTYVDIQNVYNKKPSEPPYWDQQTNQITEQKMLGIIPSIGITAEF